jgi:small RNA 2'-O-methyltransferase
VLDVGCGEGEIVACLCNAAPWLPLYPKEPIASPPHDTSSYPETDAVSLREEDGIHFNHDLLHVRNLHALDVSYEDLQQVISYAKPPAPPNDAQLWPAPNRWEPLDVKVWHGGMQVFNPEFVGIECIVSTEVYVLHSL